MGWATSKGTAGMFLFFYLVGGFGIDHAHHWTSFGILAGPAELRKDWTKTHELVGVPDGCLNSYASLGLIGFRV